MMSSHFTKWSIQVIAVAMTCTSCKARNDIEAPEREIETSVSEPSTPNEGKDTSSFEIAHEANREPNAKHCLKTRECADDEYCHLKTQSCKKKCMSHDECGEDRICRTDGRCSSKYFETVWEIVEPNMTITLPFNPRNNANDSDTTRDFFVTWGDGTEREHYYRGTDRDKISHTYRMPGKYHIKIEGVYYGWGNSGSVDEGGPDVLPLVEVVSFGNVGLTSGAFRETRIQKIPEDDVPNANSLTTLREFFYYAEEFNAPIYWDTGNVIDMFDMFEGAKQFNQPIMFDTSHVIDMTNLLAGAISFNSSINIDTSNVKLMSQMFIEAEAFNQPVPFDTHNVLDFQGMFMGAKSFNQPVNFDTSNALTLVEMFEKAESFNQPIHFNVPKVIMFCNMFADAVALNSPIKFINNDPDVSFIDGMLYGTKNFHSTIEMNINRFSKEKFDKYIRDKNESHCDISHEFDRFEDVIYPKPYSDKPSIRPIVERPKIGEYNKEHICQSREGCTCGNGYCGYLGKCVKNMCECGGYNEFDDRYRSIKSNEFKEFTCVTWPEEEDDRPGVFYESYLWICEKKDGCRYRGWIYPYRSYRKGSGNTTPDSPRILFSAHEIKFGVYDRILTPEQEKMAKDRGIVYHKADANNDRCHVWDLGSESKWINTECRKIKPEYLCEDEYCTCGKNVCERDYACSDKYECLCSNPSGCKCGNYYITWGMGCHDRTPYCGKYPMPKKAKNTKYLSCSDLDDELEWINY